MATWSVILSTLQTLQAAANKGDWTQVETVLPEMEQAISELVQEFNPSTLTREELVGFDQVRKIHGELLESARNRQRHIKAELGSLVQSQKVSRAYQRDR